MKDLTKNAAVLAVFQDAVAKLETLGLKCMAIPNDLPGYGASVSLHIGEDDMAVTAAYVASLRRGEVPHLADEEARKGFAREVAEFVVPTTHCNVTQDRDRLKALAGAGGAVAPLDRADEPGVTVHRDSSFRKAALVHLDREPSDEDLQLIEAVLKRALAPTFPRTPDESR